eukprot:4588551-Amphidinium_carterae.1
MCDSEFRMVAERERIEEYSEVREIDNEFELVSDHSSTFRQSALNQVMQRDKRDYGSHDQNEHQAPQPYNVRWQVTSIQ